MLLYNFLRRKKEEFAPLHKDFVGMYVCGPTVYGEPHLGHARSAITFDMLYRYLMFKGYTVRYIRNITDVGHLENDEEDEGEDKVEKAARARKLEPMQIAQQYTNSYRESLQKLYTLAPSIEPLASGHIIEQQQFIQELLEKGWAYEQEGNIYFDLDKFTAAHHIYGTLSGKNIEMLLSGKRALKHQTHKRNVMDFALWKTVPHTYGMSWKSPWSERGVPGWHTECSVMSKKYLGIPFDIHGGGLDLQFPHHEAEIAQTYALSAQHPANFWIYNNMITIDHAKMSKSLGNFITLEEFFTGNNPKLSRGYHPQEIKFYVVRTHYRSVIDLTEESLEGGSKGLEKLRNAEKKAIEILQTREPNTDVPNFLTEHQLLEHTTSPRAHNYCARLVSCADNDLDTPGIVALLFEGATHILSAEHDTEELWGYATVFNVFFGHILGLSSAHMNRAAHGAPTRGEGAHNITTLVDAIMHARNAARKEKNFALSDTLRDILLQSGISIKDTADGNSVWDNT